MDEAAATAEPKDQVASIAGQIAALSTGDRAQLRRLYLTRRHEADGLVIGLLHRAGVPLAMLGVAASINGPGPGSSAAQAAFEPWRLLAHVAALLSGTTGETAHAPAKRLGRALFEVGYSENRLLRLLAARGPGLHDQIVRAGRTLAQGGGPINLWTVLHLAGTDPNEAERARIRIAQDYYAAKARSEGKAE